MSRVVAVCLDGGTLDVVQAVATECGVAVDATSVENDNSFWVDDVDAIVIGNVADPLRTVRRCHAQRPSVPAVIIADDGECARIRDAIRFSPGLGRDVHCVERSQRSSIVEGIKSSIERRRTRLATQQTLGALNYKLEHAVGPTRNAAALLGRLLELAPIGVAITDARGVVRELNERAAALLVGGHASRALGAPVWDLFPDCSRERLQSLLSRFDDNHTSGQARGGFMTVGAEPFHVEVTGTALDRDAGGPGYLVLIEDTTERNALIEQLQAANRRKDEFLAMLGHELRNPLAPIRTAVELISARKVPGIDRELGVIQRQLVNVIQLVDDLLDVSRITRGKLELKLHAIEVYDVVTQAIETTSPLFEQRRHILNLDVAKNGLIVRADASRLSQVFANLLTNAAKYTPSGGTVSISARRELGDVVISVADTGKGIAPELLPKIFELFIQESQSSDRASGGLGVGLSIVRSLVELHGGKVTATSEVTKGSEFVVRLPAQPSAAISENTNTTAADPGTATGRILIVDDNVDAAELLSELLGALGHTTHIAHDGVQALKVATVVPPDVVLLDIGLPVMDGYEVAQKVRAIPGLANVSIIAISGYGQPSDSARAHEAGFEQLLVKPIDVSTLRDAIARALSDRA